MNTILRNRFLMGENKLIEFKEPLYIIPAFEQNKKMNLQVWTILLYEGCLNSIRKEEVYARM